MTLYKGDKVIAGSRSYIGNIGDIKYTARVDLPFGGSWCDGSIKLKAQFPTVYQMLIDGKLQALDIATYESALNLNGSCGFFGLDTATESFRVPSLNDVYLKAGQVADEFGAESLPNITGTFDGEELTNDKSAKVSTTGALYAYDSKKNYQATGATPAGAALGFDASRCSSTYQDGAKVNPDHVKYRAYVVLYTGADTNIDITKEIQLNNPFSLLDYKWSEYELSNASWLLSNGAFHSGATYVAVYELLLKIKNGTETKDGVSVKLSTEAYTDTDFVINTADTTFRLPIKVKLASGNAVVGNGMTLGLYDGTTNGGFFFDSGNNATSRRSFYGQPVGTDSGTGQLSTKSIGITTDATKSGIETSSQGLMLYFYVGDVVSDANLLNAGKVLDLLAKLESYDCVVERQDGSTDLYIWYTERYKSGYVRQYFLFPKKSSYSMQTIKMPIPMANTDYIAVPSVSEYDASTSIAFTHMSIVNKTTTTFQTKNDNAFVKQVIIYGKAA